MLNNLSILMLKPDLQMPQMTRFKLGFNRHALRGLLN